MFFTSVLQIYVSLTISIVVCLLHFVCL